jgi:predicted anti-sigma-YlaC factor YlaD
MSLFGGLCPLIISALAVALQPASHAAGVVVVLTALITFASGVALVKVAPATNAPCPAGQHTEYLAQQQERHTEASQMQQVVVPHA